MDQAGSKLLRGLLEVFLLESLEREPKHGYAILKEMADSFGVEPNRNRLYPLLGRLVKEGWVHELNDGTAGRTIYGLTEEGRTQLEAYRRLPRAFKETVGRVWSGAAPPAPAAQPPREAAPPMVAPRSIPLDAAPERPRPPAPAPQPTAPAQSPPQAPAQAPAAAPAGAPYPCPDARVGLSKDPRTGNLTIQLTGCPMGAYEYCPQCPVAKSVEGLRKIVFSL